MPFIGTMLLESEPNRECWHEAGHALVAHHLGMTVLAIGFSWVRGEHHEPNPSSWIPTDGFDKDIVAVELFGGVAAEILKLGDYDVMAHGSDVDPKPEKRATDKLSRIVASRGSLEEREENHEVAKRGHTEEQILRALRQAEAGTRVADICREHGISEQSFYFWKKKYSGLGLSELRELRQLREENSKLKHLVADLSLDRQILQEIVQKSCKASPSARAGGWTTSSSAEPASGVGADR